MGALALNGDVNVGINADKRMCQIHVFMFDHMCTSCTCQTHVIIYICVLHTCQTHVITYTCVSCTCTKVHDVDLSSSTHRALIKCKVLT